MVYRALIKTKGFGTQNLLLRKKKNYIVEPHWHRFNQSIRHSYLKAFDNQEQELAINSDLPNLLMVPYVASLREAILENSGGALLQKGVEHVPDQDFIEIPDTQFEFLEDLALLRSKEEQDQNDLLIKLPNKEAIRIKKYMGQMQNRTISVCKKQLKKAATALKKMEKKMAKLNDSSEKPEKYSYPSFFKLNPAETARYEMYFSQLSDKITFGIEIATLIELVCLDKNQDLYPTDPNFLKGSLPVIMATLWSNANDHPYYIRLKKQKEVIYRYNSEQLKSEVAPFSIITSQQFRYAISQWVKKQFNQFPPGILSGNTFINNLQSQLNLIVPIIEDSFTDKYKNGLALTDGFFYLDNVSPLFRFILYDSSLFISETIKGQLELCQVMPQDRKAMQLALNCTTYPSVNQQGILTTQQLVERVKKTATPLDQINKTELTDSLIQITLYWATHPFLLFISNLCEQDPLNIFIIRTLFNRVILADLEGGNYESCHWLFGIEKGSLPIIISLLILLAGVDGYEKIDEKTNSFSDIELEKIKVLFVSQVHNLKPGVVSQLKEMLTKNIFNHNPSKKRCQLVFTSDRAPQEANAVFDTAILREKMIPLKLNKKIPRKYRREKLSDYLSFLLPQIYAWSLLIDRNWLFEQTRAHAILNTQYEMGLAEGTLLNQFIKSCLVRVKNFPTMLEVNQANERELKRKREQQVGFVSSTKQSRIRRETLADERATFVSKVAVTKACKDWLNSIKSSLTNLTEFNELIDCSYLAGRIFKTIELIYGLPTLQRRQKTVDGYAGIRLKVPNELYDSQYIEFLEDHQSYTGKTILQANLADVLYKPYPMKRQHETDFILVGNKDQIDLLDYTNEGAKFELLKTGKLEVCDKYGKPLKPLKPLKP